MSCQCVLPSNLASGEVTTRTADILSAQMPWRSDPARMPGATGIFFQSMSMLLTLPRPIMVKMNACVFHVKHEAFGTGAAGLLRTR